MRTVFRKLSADWNAEPSAPEPVVSLSGDTVELSFIPNRFIYPNYSEVERVVLSFFGCRMYRLGATNDEGWYLGQCRFSDTAPEWGEFYEVGGDSKLTEVDDWIDVGELVGDARHFLFYFRDETFECVAQDWEKANAA